MAAPPAKQPRQDVIVQTAAGLWRPLLMVRGEPQPLGREHESRVVAEAAWDLYKLRLGLELGKSMEEMAALALHRPPSFYAQHPTWSSLAALAPLEVASLLAGGLAADFVEAPAPLPRHTRAGRAGLESPRTQRVERGSLPQQQQQQKEASAEPRRRAAAVRRQFVDPKSWVEWPGGSGQWVHALSLRILSKKRIYLPDRIRIGALGIVDISGSVSVQHPSASQAASSGGRAPPGVSVSQWELFTYSRPKSTRTEVELRLPAHFMLANQLDEGDVLALRPVEANCVAVRVLKAGSPQVLAVTAAFKGKQAAPQVKRAAPPAPRAHAPVPPASSRPLSGDGRAAPHGSTSDLFYSSSGSSDGESNGGSREGCSSPRYSFSDEGASSSEDEEPLAEEDSLPARGAQGGTPAGSGSHRGRFDSVWHEFPAASRQFAFIVPLHTMQRACLTVPVWVRKAGFPGGSAGSSMRVLMEVAGDVGSGQASAAYECNVTSGARGRNPRTLLYPPASFFKAHKVKVGDVLALRVLGPDRLSCQVWHAGSPAAQRFHAFKDAPMSCPSPREDSGMAGKKRRRGLTPAPATPLDGRRAAGEERAVEGRI